MAIMFGCATDWTYDLFIEDSKLYNATPIKGVHCRRDASDREMFMVWLKNLVRDFKENWISEGKNLWDRYDGWIGDCFKEELYNSCFSDIYKDTYGQRPHLPIWFYINAVDLPTGEDVARTFCATPVENAIRNAKETRINLLNKQW